MRFVSLGSGSRGNGTLIESGDQLVLVDNGFNLKEIARRLANVGHCPEDITAVLVTHEHGDHIKGVGPFARKFQVPVYMTRGTFHGRDLGRMPTVHFIEGFQAFSLGNLTVRPVAVPHDAREPTQFVFSWRNLQLGILTDLGSISEHVWQSYCDCDAMLLESNHDLEMLAQGPYPDSLKRRVAGDWGHLNNEQAAEMLGRMRRRRLHKLVVGHLSQQNNCPDIARQALSEPLGWLEEVFFACQEEGSQWMSVAD